MLLLQRFSHSLLSDCVSASLCRYGTAGSGSAVQHIWEHTLRTRWQTDRDRHTVIETELRFSATERREKRETDTEPKRSLPLLHCTERWRTEYRIQRTEHYWRTEPTESAAKASQSSALLLRKGFPLRHFIITIITRFLLLYFASDLRFLCSSSVCLWSLITDRTDRLDARRQTPDTSGHREEQRFGLAINCFDNSLCEKNILLSSNITLSCARFPTNTSADILISIYSLRKIRFLFLQLRILFFYIPNIEWKDFILHSILPHSLCSVRGSHTRTDTETLSQRWPNPDGRLARV